MKPQEIRIGNWVMGNKPYQWGLDDFADWYYDHNSHTYGDSVKPIPLTEEWLQKFGFEKKKYPNPRVWANRYVKDRFELGHTFSGLIKNREHKYYHGGRDIQYVHQLQNLYFALTGEELTVK